MTEAVHKLKAHCSCGAKMNVEGPYSMLVHYGRDFLQRHHHGGSNGRHGHVSINDEELRPAPVDDLRAAAINLLGACKDLSKAWPKPNDPSPTVIPAHMPRRMGESMALLEKALAMSEEARRG